MDSKISQCSIVNVKDADAPPKTMTFDGAYYTDSTTEAIYNEIAFPLVEVYITLTIKITTLEEYDRKFIYVL